VKFWKPFTISRSWSRLHTEKVFATQCITLALFSAWRGVLGRYLLWRRGCLCGCLCVCHVDVLCSIHHATFTRLWLSHSSFLIPNMNQKQLDGIFFIDGVKCYVMSRVLRGIYMASPYERNVTDWRLCTYTASGGLSAVAELLAWKGIREFLIITPCWFSQERKTTFG